MHLLVGTNKNDNSILKFFVHIIGAVFWPRMNSVPTLQYGSTVAKVVSCRLPTVAARVRGICGGQSKYWGRYSLSAPVSLANHSTAPQSSSIIRGWYNRPNSGQHTKCTQSHPTPTKLKNKIIFLC
jgi:hypothetical protein